MEGKINYIQLVLTLLVTLVGIFGGIWGAWELFMKAEQTAAIDKRFSEVKYITVNQAESQIKELVLDERERQAEKKTGSLSHNIALELRELGVQREDVAPLIGKVAKFGIEQMRKAEERETIWNEFVKTRYICPVLIEDKLYFRYTDGDYPITKKDLGDGNYFSFWRHPKDDDKRFLPSISNVKDAQ